MKPVQSVWVGTSIAVTCVSRHDRALVPVVSFSHEAFCQLEQICGIKLRAVIQCLGIFLARNRIVRSQRSRRHCPGKSRRKHDHEQVQHRILIHISQQSPEPGPSRSPHKPKRVKKKPRRVNDAVYSSPPDPKRDKGPRKGERGRRPTTSERSRRPNEPGASRTQNEPGKLDPSYPKQYTQLTYSFMQYSSSRLHRSHTRRHPLNHLQSLCQVHYSHVLRPCFQTLPPCFKLHAYSASLTIPSRPRLDNLTQSETKSTQRWRTITLKPTSVQVCCRINLTRVILDPCL